MEINILSTYKQFLSLGEKWNHLLHKSDSDTIFLTFEWIKAWIDNFLNQDELFIITVSNEKKELIGIAPLCIRKTKFVGFLPMRTIVFIGDRDAGSEYLDFIILKGSEEHICQSIFQFLKKNKQLYDFLFLKEIPESSPNLKFMETLSIEAGFKLIKSHRACSEVKLPDSWEKYLKMLKPRFRTKIRSARRKLLEQHKVNFYILDNEGEIDDSLITLFRLHQKKWVEIGETGTFYRISKRTFYRDISHAFLQKGWLLFSFLEIDDEIRACQYSFVYKNEIKHLQEGFDPDWNEKDIGNVLRGYVMESLISKGILIYDFLGGITFHKRTWGAEEKYSFHITLLKKGDLKNIIFDLLRKMKRFFIIIFPDSLTAARHKRLTEKSKQRIKAREQELLNIDPPFKQ